MSNISSQLETILATRAARLRTLDADIAGWEARADEVARTLAAVSAAEQANPDLAGASANLRSVSEALRRVLEDGAKVRARFARDTLCIGIGGAARSPNSTGDAARAERIATTCALLETSIAAFTSTKVF